MTVNNDIDDDSAAKHCDPHMERTKTKTVWIVKQQSAMSIKVGAVDLGCRPLGSTPKSPRHDGRNAHLSQKKKHVERETAERLLARQAATKR